MTLSKLLEKVDQIFNGADEKTRISRRNLLSGLGLATACVAAGPVLLASTGAAAAGNETAEDLLEEIQYGGSGRGRSPGPGRGRRRSPPRRTPSRRRGQRYSRGQLQAQCRNPGFRARNRQLCAQVAGRPRRRGTCFQIGPVTICD